MRRGTLMRRLSVLVLAAALAAGLAGAQDNPFFTPAAPGAESGSATPGAEEARPSAGPGTLSLLVAGVQRTLSSALSDAARAVSAGGSAGPLLALAGLSFVYGLVHAAGPGHGKTVIATLVLARGSRPREVLAAGLATAVVHTGSAAGLTFAAWFALRAVSTAWAENAGRWLQGSSYLLLALVGAFMSWQAIRSLLGRGHGHADGDAPARSDRGLVAAAAAAGLVPCSGAMLVMTVCLSLGIPLAGLVAVGALSAGMSVTIAAAGFASLAARRGVDAAASKARAPGFARRLGAWLSLAGSLAITAIGVALARSFLVR
ncbi:MAG: hypothetical protein JXA15_02830 [Spirochaetales bacterium]|nr:hypothetical protein [Spirochaetales bacterium]